MSGKILVAVCGVGDPNFDSKLSSIIKNIKIINQTAPEGYNNGIDFLFFAYDDSLQKSLIEYDNCKIIRESGFVGEFIYNHLQPSMVSHYDRIIVMLDDIEIQQNFDLSTVIDIQDMHGFDIISPTLTIDSKINHEFMKTRESLPNNSVMNTGFVEFFMYIMKPASDGYAKWLSCFDEQTKTMWGIDIILNLELKLKLGLINDMTIKHLFKGGSKNGGIQELRRLFERVNKKHEENGTVSPIIQNDLTAIRSVERIVDIYKY